VCVCVCVCVRARARACVSHSVLTVQRFYIFECIGWTYIRLFD